VEAEALHARRPIPLTRGITKPESPASRPRGPSRSHGESMRLSRAAKEDGHPAHAGDTIGSTVPRPNTLGPFPLTRAMIPRTRRCTGRRCSAHPLGKRRTFNTAWDGSSPQGIQIEHKTAPMSGTRGILKLPRTNRRQVRSTPAHAGNTPAGHRLIDGKCGPSPRGGIRCRPGGRASTFRSIPARAGNTCGLGCSGTICVGPSRSRGEYRGNTV
jgi:hypothetical protein